MSLKTEIANYKMVMKLAEKANLPAEVIDAYKRALSEASAGLRAYIADPEEFGQEEG